MPNTSEQDTEASDMAAASVTSEGGEPSGMMTKADDVQRVVPRFRVGERFGDFVILRELGSGGFATVYLALDVPLDRKIALKVSEARGLGEGKTLAELQHEHIVAVYAQFTDAETNKHCLCLQFVPGTTLASVIRRIHDADSKPTSGQAILDAVSAELREEVAFDPGGLRNRELLAASSFPAAVCRIGRQLAEALHFAHGRNILHSDIKPANVLMNPYGRPLLADFNVSTVVEGPRTNTGGTLAYMSPEQLSAHMRMKAAPVDERSDIYALGVLLFETLTGKLPFEGFGISSLLTLLEAQKGFNATVTWKDARKIPAVVERVLRRCLDPLPERRYADAGQLALALDHAADLLSIEAALPRGKRVTAWALSYPIAMLLALTLLPHVVGTIVNIFYNAVEINLTPAQQAAFGRTVPIYNLLIYPAAIVLMLRAVSPVVSVWRHIDTLGTIPGPQVDAIRRRALKLGSWGMFLALAGWLPGGIIFPFAIDMLAGPIGSRTYAHFMLSFTLSGLIALIYTLFGVQFIVLRVFYPRLGNADNYSRQTAREELARVSRWFGPFQLLAAVVPLAGAVLLVAVTGEMSLSFRLLMTSLIVLGMVGVGLVLTLSRVLNQIVRALEGQSARV